MEIIKAWAFALCAAVVAGSILRILMPRGGMHRVFSLTLSVFILCCILSPFMLGNPDFRIELEIYAAQEAAERAQGLSQLVEAQSEQAIALEVEKIVLSKLNEMGINHHGIAININHDGQNTPASLEAFVFLGEEDRENEARIRRELQETLGFPVVTAITRR